MQSMVLQNLTPTHPPFPSTHKPNPLTIFPFFPTMMLTPSPSYITTLNGNVQLAQSRCPDIFPLALHDIFQTLVTTNHFDLTSLLFYVNEGGKGYTLPSCNSYKTFTDTDKFPKLTQIVVLLLMSLKAVGQVNTLLFL